MREARRQPEMITTGGDISRVWKSRQIRDTRAPLTPPEQTTRRNLATLNNRGRRREYARSTHLLRRGLVERKDAFVDLTDGVDFGICKGGRDDTERDR